MVCEKRDTLLKAWNPLKIARAFSSPAREDYQPRITRFARRGRLVFQPATLRSIQDMLKGEFTWEAWMNLEYAGSYMGWRTLLTAANVQLITIPWGYSSTKSCRLSFRILKGIKGEPHRYDRYNSAWAGAGIDVTRRDDAQLMLGRQWCPFGLFGWRVPLSS